MRPRLLWCLDPDTCTNIIISLFIYILQVFSSNSYLMTIITCNMQEHVICHVHERVCTNAAMVPLFRNGRSRFSFYCRPSFAARHRRLREQRSTVAHEAECARPAQASGAHPPSLPGQDKKIHARWLAHRPTPVSATRFSTRAVPR